MAARRYEISLWVLKNIRERVKYFFQHEKRNFISPSDHVMFYLLYKHQWNTKPFYLNSFWSEWCGLLWSHSNGDIFTCKDNMSFSHVKISSFRAKAHLVFHWCLYNKMIYIYFFAEKMGPLPMYESSLLSFYSSVMLAQRPRVQIHLKPHPPSP